MTEKEKAKAYDEALKKASVAYKDEDRHLKTTLERIFPELNEDKNEKIKNAILDLLKTWRNYKDYVYGVHVEDAIDWLEMQGKKSSWKPSKEEMDVLYSLSYITNEYDGHKEDVITHLYQDLKREFFNDSSYENMFSLDNKEDDVRRRSTIQVLEYVRSLDAYNQYGKADINKNIAWFEKQGENSTDKTKPRFNIGDWVVDITDKSIYQVEKKENCQYILRHHILGDLILNLPFSLEGLIREWTIQDAKDGDVIHMGEVTAIFKKYIGGEKCICYCYFCKDGGFEIPIENGEVNVYGCYNATPATKEQRDTLMKAMNDAGYEWDAENKELKKHKR